MGPQGLPLRSTSAARRDADSRLRSLLPPESCRSQPTGCDRRARAVRSKWECSTELHVSATPCCPHAPLLTLLACLGASGMLCYALSVALRHPAPGSRWYFDEKLQESPWLLRLHILMSAPTPLLAAFQLLRPGACHRTVGWSYVALSTGSAVTGIASALSSAVGSLGMCGMVGLGVWWAVACWMGVVQAVWGGSDGAEHRKWMVRSAMVPVVAITQRLYMFCLLAVGCDFDEVYPAVVTFAWVPPIVGLELWFRLRE
jgi:uncharacterized membrane protein